MQSFKQDVLPLKAAFEKILSTENFGSIASDIAETIAKDELNQKSFQQLLDMHGIKKVNSIKPYILDLVISYINLILEDNYITRRESENVSFLKRYFRIEEGEFYRLKYHEIGRIIDMQISSMYIDGKINRKESLQKVELQRLFDLGYDQFLEFIDKAVRNALARGADPLDLDTFIKLD